MTGNRRLLKTLIIISWKKKSLIKRRDFVRFGSTLSLTVKRTCHRSEAQLRFTRDREMNMERDEDIYNFPGGGCKICQKLPMRLIKTSSIYSCKSSESSKSPVAQERNRDWSYVVFQINEVAWTLLFSSSSCFFIRLRSPPAAARAVHWGSLFVSVSFHRLKSCWDRAKRENFTVKCPRHTATLS